MSIWLVWLLLGEGEPGVDRESHEVGLGPWANSLTTSIDSELEQLEFPKIDAPALVLRQYQTAWENKWPTREWRRLDDWRERLFQRYGYAGQTEVGDRAWTVTGVEDLVPSDDWESIF